MGTGIFLTGIAMLAAVQPLFARDFRCEDAFTRPTFESVQKNLSKKFPVVFRRLLKADRGLAEATHQMVGDKHVFRFSDQFNAYSEAYRFSTLLHEVTHLATARYFENPESEVGVGRAIELEETSFKDYEDVYGFDELEARIRELAVLVEAAKLDYWQVWEAKAKMKDIRHHLLFQRVVLRKTLDWIEAGETSVKVEPESVILELKNCKRRSFCRMSILRRDDVIGSQAQAHEYIRRIFAVRSHSLDIRLETAKRISKRLDGL